MAVQVVVEFGSTWCTHCEEMFPHFLRLSRLHPQNKYILAQVDYMGDEAKVCLCCMPKGANAESQHPVPILVAVTMTLQSPVSGSITHMRISFH